jgi:hypothetical protein
MQGRSGPVSNRELTDALAVHNETIRRTVYRMVDSGDLRPSGDGRYTLAAGTAAVPATPEVSAQAPEHQGDDQELQDTASVPSHYGRDTSQGTLLYSGGIGVYDPNAPGEVRPWRPKVG